MNDQKINEEELTGQELMQKALDELISDPTAIINQLQVAKKAGRGHSVFRKLTYKEVKKNIIDAQKVREIELENLSKEEKIKELEAQLETTKNQIANINKQNTETPKLKDIKAAEGQLISRLTEMYRYNDALRNQLIETHQMDIDEKTGEILHVEFGRKK